jgi:hypothetical protein
MPIYEFYSPDTNKVYQFLARNLSMREQMPRCPDGAGHRMQRRLSRFAIIGKAKEETDGELFPGMDEAQAEAVMADMEREMDSMDDHHPDPRQLGRLMRQVSDLMGNRAPDALREVVRRLEAGEDPDHLEQTFGPMEDADGNPIEGGAADELWNTVKKTLRGLRDEPQRDPKLYEMRDYV